MTDQLFARLLDSAPDAMIVIGRDGKKHLVRGSKFIVNDGKVVPMGIGAIEIDITEPRRIESQLRQAQKMEAVGQLTGGVSGRDIVARALPKRPALAVIYVSGYSAAIEADDPIEASAVRLAKPYQRAALALALRRALGDDAAGDGI